RRGRTRHAARVRRPGDQEHALSRPDREGIPADREDAEGPVHVRGPGFGGHGDRRRRRPLPAQGRALRRGRPRPLPLADAGRSHPARQGDALARAVRDQDRATLPVMSGPRFVGVASALILGVCLALLAVEGVGEDGFRAVIRLTARTSLVLFLLAFTASAAFRARRGPATDSLLANRRYLVLSISIPQVRQL